MLKILQPARFSCQRTCTPGHDCRFTPILRAIGRARVVSHTTRVEVELRDPSALSTAVLKMGGTILGQGHHSLFSTREEGYGFKIPGWMYPLILRNDHSLAFDSYNGAWGNEADIAKLTAHYAIEAARQAADMQGWNSEEQHDGSLKIEHPSGAHMTVQADGTVEAFGFIGSACDVTSVIEEAMGTPGDSIKKPEYDQHGGLRV